MNGFDLWELTTLYQEVHGTPTGRSIRPARHPAADLDAAQPERDAAARAGPPSLVDYYRYRTGDAASSASRRTRSSTSAIPIRATPTPAACPRCGPARAGGAHHRYAAFKGPSSRTTPSPTPSVAGRGHRRGGARPPGNAVEQRFRRGGSGKVVVAEARLKVQLLPLDGRPRRPGRHERDQGGHRQRLPRAAGFLTARRTWPTSRRRSTSTWPRRCAAAAPPRREAQRQLVPLFDPTAGCSSPATTRCRSTASDREGAGTDLKYGVVTINEVRAEQGLPPVPWGDLPWLPLQWAVMHVRGGRAYVKAKNRGGRKEQTGKEGGKAKVTKKTPKKLAKINPKPARITESAMKSLFHNAPSY